MSNFKFSRLPETTCLVWIQMVSLSQLIIQLMDLMDNLVRLARSETITMSTIDVNLQK